MFSIGFTKMIANGITRFKKGASCDQSCSNTTLYIASVTGPTVTVARSANTREAQLSALKRIKTPVVAYVTSVSTTIITPTQTKAIQPAHRMEDIFHWHDNDPQRPKVELDEIPFSTPHGRPVVRPADQPQLHEVPKTEWGHLGSSSQIRCPQHNNWLYKDLNTFKIFEIECYIDRHGGDLPSPKHLVYVNNVEQCITACARTQGCVDISLLGGECYLKGRVQTPVQNGRIIGARLKTQG